MILRKKLIISILFIGMLVGSLAAITAHDTNLSKDKKTGDVDKIPVKITLMNIYQTDEGYIIYGHVLTDQGHPVTNVTLTAIYTDSRTGNVYTKTQFFNSTFAGAPSGGYSFLLGYSDISKPYNITVKFEGNDKYLPCEAYVANPVWYN